MSWNVLQKAKIVNLNTNKEVECHFNPAEFEYSKTVKWEEKTNQGSDTPTLVYSGGEASDLTVNLLFDTTHLQDKVDVRDSYSDLVKMAEVDENSRNSTTGMGEPPQCRFQWGKFLAFTAVIKSIKQKFILFSGNGTPLRAEVSVTFKQVGELVRPQNPTSRSEIRKTWLVHEGQTLDWIAYQEYGSSAHWRHIAETNNLDDPMDLQSGQILKLTPLL